MSIFCQPLIVCDLENADGTVLYTVYWRKLEITFFVVLHLNEERWVGRGKHAENPPRNLLIFSWDICCTIPQKNIPKTQNKDDSSRNVLCHQMPNIGIPHTAPRASTKWQGFQNFSLQKGVFSFYIVNYYAKKH